MKANKLKFPDKVITMRRVSRAMPYNMLDIFLISSTVTLEIINDSDSSQRGGQIIVIWPDPVDSNYEVSRYVHIVEPRPWSTLIVVCKKYLPVVKSGFVIFFKVRVFASFLKVWIKSVSGIVLTLTISNPAAFLDKPCHLQQNITSFA